MMERSTRAKRILESATSGFVPQRLFKDKYSKEQRLEEDKVKKWLQTNEFSVNSKPSCSKIDKIQNGFEMSDLDSMEFVFDDEIMPLPSEPLISNETNEISVSTSVVINEVTLNNVLPEAIINNPLINDFKLSDFNKIANNVEYTELIQETKGGRKLKKTNKRNLAKIEKNNINNNIIIECNHKHVSKPFCKISEISVDTIQQFLISMMSIEKPIRTDRRKAQHRYDRNTVKYFIPTIEGKIPVCATVFRSITSITRKRLNIIANNFKNNFSSPKEKRGGSRLTLQDEQLTQSIIDHIQNFKSKKSHYSRADTGRSYLPPGLSVKLMYNHWKNEMITNNKKYSSFSKYYLIFTTKFNLGFGNPRQDVCGYCVELDDKIKYETNLVIQNELKENLTAHKYLSKQFHNLMKETNEKSINISFDMMQNQPLPKLSVTETFYSRQIWLYNLTFVLNSKVQNPNSCFMYTWLETESGRGPNEVTSALIDFLEMIDNQLQTQKNPPIIINLFSDSCSAQNKNQFIMIALLYFINYKAKIINEIHHYFPIRGHSYMPPDQVFGRIEKNLRQMESIVSPDEYYQVFKKYTTLKTFNKDYNIIDYKSAVKKIVKKLEFKSTEQKHFSYIRGKKTVGVSSTYKEEPLRVRVLKKLANLENIGLAEILPKTNHVKLPKQEDVRKLLKFFTIPPEAQEFYNDIFTSIENADSEKEDIE